MPSYTTRWDRGNTPRSQLQDQGMPIASPTPITPLTLREPARRDPHAPRDHASATGLQRADHSAFRAFVDANYFLFADYVARRLNGPHAGAAEDALQEGLIKIWNEWDEWPTDESERIRFARQALRIAALEAIRKRTGRDGSPRAGEIVVDFADLDGHARPAPAAEQLARDLGKAIAAQSLVKDQLAFLEKASLVAAIATLSDLEQRVLFKTAQGDDCKEIATDLGVTHQQAREALMRARRLSRMLIEHADGQKVSEQEAKLLWQYADGQLSGKRARELKRHIEHCTACQRLLGLEETIGTNGALVVLPIPVLLLAAGKTLTGGSVAAASAGAVGSGSAAGGAGVGAQLGGTVLAPVAPSVTFGSVIAGVTAKAGLGLAGLAVAGSFAGVYKLAHDRQQQERAALSTPAPAVTRQMRDAVLATTATPSKRNATAKKATPKNTAKPRPRRAKAKTQSATTGTAAAVTTTAPRTVTARRPVTTSPAPTPRATTAATTVEKPSSSPGGEFVLGSR